MESLYEVSMQSAAKSGGLKLAHKLTREHLFLTPRSRMRVDLAAQAYMLRVYIICGLYCVDGIIARVIYNIIIILCIT